MTTFIIKSLKTTLEHTQIDSHNFLTTLKNSLLEIITTLTQQIQQMQHNHQEEISHLNAIIEQKQLSIQKLKQMQENTINKMQKQSLESTPYKILLKSKSNQCILNQKSLNNEQSTQNQYSLQPQPINDHLSTRLSFQLDTNIFIDKPKNFSCASSHLKNKLSTKIKNLPIFPPRDFVQENIQMVTNYNSVNTNPNINMIKYHTEKGKSGKCQTARCRASDYVSNDIQNNQKKNADSADKLNFGQNKQLLFQKNKKKKSLFSKKNDQFIIFQATKYKGIPNKTLVKALKILTSKPR